MHLETAAIICALLPHGEHGGVVRVLTPEHGLQPVYVRGARGRRMRPVLIPGNLVRAEISRRSDTQLAHATIELTQSRAILLSEPLAASAMEWACALVATVLPEEQPYPALYTGLSGLLDAIEAAPSASGWGAGLVRFELLLLAEMGFGLDLDRCAITGEPGELVAVSPNSGRAVSAGAAEPYSGRLLALPGFLACGAQANLPDVVAGLDLTGHFLLRDVMSDRGARVLEARRRLTERLRRAASH